MAEPTAYEKMFTKRTAAVAPGRREPVDPRKSINGLYPRNPKTGGPSITALRIGAQFQVLKALCIAQGFPCADYANALIPTNPDCAATFIGHMYRDHAEALLPFENGSLPVAELVLSLTVPATGLKRSNITLSHQP